MPDRRIEGEEQTSEVWVTVLPGRDRRPPWQWSRRLSERIPPASAIAVVVAIAAIAAAALYDPGGEALSPAHASGPAGIAAAYGYPLRCLSVTTSSSNTAYARVDFDRRSACGRYDWSVVAIFHRAGGLWRPVLETGNYRCPVASLPAAVQRQLSVCL
jgi:hypothetical protein